MSEGFCLEVSLELGYEGFCKVETQVFIDGDQWCVLAGDNLQEGVAGFGTTIHEALQKFKQCFSTKLEKVPAND
jgi:hypothetical protein